MGIVITQVSNTVGIHHFPCFLIDASLSNNSFEDIVSGISELEGLTLLPYLTDVSLVGLTFWDENPSDLE